MKKKLYLLSLLVRRNCGFTMIEFMVASIIFLTVMVQIGSSWSSFYKWISYVSGRTQSGSEARVARNIVARDLDNTQEVLHSLSNKWNLQTYDSGPGNVVVYENQNGSLTRSKVSGTDTVVVSKGINEVVFTDNQNGRSVCSVKYSKDKYKGSLEFIVSNIQKYQGPKGNNGNSGNGNGNNGNGNGNGGSNGNNNGNSGSGSGNSSKDKKK